MHSKIDDPLFQLHDEFGNEVPWNFEEDEINEDEYYMSMITKNG